MKQDRSHAFLLHFLHLFPSLSVRMGIRKELIKNVYQKKISRTDELKSREMGGLTTRHCVPVREKWGQ